MNYKARNRIVRQIFLEKITEDKMCCFCGEAPATDAAHLIRRSYSIALITNRENIVPACRECHDIFDNQKSKRHKLKNIKAIVEKIKSLDELYYNKNFLDLQV